MTVNQLIVASTHEEACLTADGCLQMTSTHATHLNCANKAAGVGWNTGLSCLLLCVSLRERVCRP
eukprot:COSAG01_NODE_874_length_12972_cov_15.914343_8_plen_65_part_00